MLVLWGSPSDKLATLLQTRSTPMLQNRFIIHMRGCHEYTTHPSHLDDLPINWIFSGCNPTKSDYHTLINEARRCLRV